MSAPVWSFICIGLSALWFWMGCQFGKRAERERIAWRLAKIVAQVNSDASLRSFQPDIAEGMLETNLRYIAIVDNL